MRYLYFIVFLAITSITFGQLSVNGDMEVRGRYDKISKGDYGNSSENFYYLYRTRLNLKFDIGDGWFAKTQLSHAGYGGFGFVGYERTETRIPTSVDGAIRTGVHFMQAYFGRSTKNYGFAGGLIPLNGVANPLLDVHYYPDRIVDIPFALFSVNGAFGFNGYVKFGESKLNLMLLVDSNEGVYVEGPDEEVIQDENDSYTVGADYEIPVGDFTVIPRLMVAISNDSTNQPITAGVSLKTPKVGLFSFSATGGYSANSMEGTTEYNIVYARFGAKGKVGPGTLNLWYDYATKTETFNTGDVDHNYGYLWAHYNYTVYSGERGSVNIGARFRLATETVDNAKDFQRIKLEFPLFITFK